MTTRPDFLHEICWSRMELSIQMNCRQRVCVCALKRVHTHATHLTSFVEGMVLGFVGSSFSYVPKLSPVYEIGWMKFDFSEVCHLWRLLPVPEWQVSQEKTKILKTVLHPPKFGPGMEVGCDSTTLYLPVGISLCMVVKCYQVACGYVMS